MEGQEQPLEVTAGESFKDTVIRVDNHYFENCTIVGCTLVFSGGDFGLVDCTITDCKMRLAGPAGRTVQFMNCFVGQGQAKTPQLNESPLIH